MTPIGDSVPWGVSTVTSSPTVTPSWRARSWPITTPGGLSSEAGAASALNDPCFMAAVMSVTAVSSAGSTPLMLMNASPWGPETRALPGMAGAAPITPGTVRRAAASAS